MGSSEPRTQVAASALLPEVDRGHVSTKTPQPASPKQRKVGKRQRRQQEAKAARKSGRNRFTSEILNESPIVYTCACGTSRPLGKLQYDVLRCIGENCKRSITLEGGPHAYA